jgi:hypothetical protein
VLITPGWRRIRSCIPQKHPPARIAVCVEAMVAPLIASHHFSSLATEHNTAAAAGIPHVSIS